MIRQNSLAYFARLESIPADSREAVNAVFGSFGENFSGFQMTSESQHEVEYVMHWLEPGYPRYDQSSDVFGVGDLVSQALAHVKLLEAPSSRIKVAIRQCLKDEHAEGAFVTAYSCTMMAEFGKWFPREFETLEQVLVLVGALREYYELRLMYLNLSLGAKQMFSANLAALLETYLMHKSNFLPLTKLKLAVSGNVSTEDENTIVSIGLVLQLFLLTSDLYQLILDLQIGRIRHLVHSFHDYDKACLKKIHVLISTELRRSNWKKLNPLLVDLEMLLKFTNNELITLKISNCYKIIEHYPQSQDSLDELYNCLVQLENHYYQRNKLVHTFVESCQHNLLHSGVNTVDIIKYYTKTIRLFLIIDPRGVLLDRVVRPIRRYLKNREDTVSILVKGILDLSPENQLLELAEDLRTTKDTHKASLYYDDINDLTLKWVPDPLDALPDFKRDRITDIIESLISIFDSKDLFIAQITKYFVEPLIGSERWNVDEIATDLKYLKLKFGDEKFTNLDIMIDDVRQSLSKKTSQANPFFDSVVLSHLYWPNLDSTSELSLPASLQDKFDEYAASYKEEKPGRFIRLLPNLGTVKIELTDFKTKQPKEYSVSPLEAMLIYQFNNVDSELSVNALIEKLGAKEYEIRKALEFWCKEGILLEITNQLYMVADEEDGENIFG